MIKPRTVLIVVVGAAAAGVVAGVAWATIPGSGGVIQGCYQKNVGNLRVVETSSDCKPSELAVSWNQKGEKGDTGAVGPVGATGPQGPKGDRRQGRQGRHRPSGPHRRDRAAGAAGAARPSGRKGRSRCGRRSRADRTPRPGGSSRWALRAPAREPRRANGPGERGGRAIRRVSRRQESARLLSGRRPQRPRAPGAGVLLREPAPAWTSWSTTATSSPRTRTSSAPCARPRAERRREGSAPLSGPTLRAGFRRTWGRAGRLDASSRRAGHYRDGRLP